MSLKKNLLKVVYSSSQNPFYNLSFEGHLLTSLERSLAATSAGGATPYGERTLFLWRNEPTVVIGRYQNPYLECNINYMNEIKAHLARRQSGGGAVYQDLGNSIYTFLSPRSLFSKQDNFDIIKNAMSSLGYSVDVSGRNDMTIFVPDLEALKDKSIVPPNSGFIPGCDLKISGSAFKAMQHAELQHGTLLVDVDMEQMAKILTPNILKLQSKGITSVRSRVINLKNVPSLMNQVIREHGEGVLLRKNPTTGKYEETNVQLKQHSFAEKIDHDIICKSLHKSFVDFYHGDDQTVRVLSSDDLFDASIEEKIAQMSNEEWRFGASPKFNIQFTHKFPFALVDVHIDKVSQSVIDHVSIFTDSLAIDWVPVLEKSLKGVGFNRADILEAGRVAGSQLSEEEAKYCQEVSQWICQELSLTA